MSHDYYVGGDCIVVGEFRFVNHFLSGGWFLYEGTEPVRPATETEAALASVIFNKYHGL